MFLEKTGCDPGGVVGERSTSENGSTDELDYDGLQLGWVRRSLVVFGQELEVSIRLGLGDD